MSNTTKDEVLIEFTREEIVELANWIPFIVSLAQDNFLEADWKDAVELGVAFNLLTKIQSKFDQKFRYNPATRRMELK